MATPIIGKTYIFTKSGNEVRVLAPDSYKSGRLEIKGFTVERVDTLKRMFAPADCLKTKSELGLNWVYDDGGRKVAGFKGVADDCVVRAVAIATGLPYLQIYNAINEHAKKNEKIKEGKKGSTARTGVFKKTTRTFLESVGFTWTPTMQIGAGCKVHLRESELPKGTLIVSVSKHIIAVIDGVIHDTHNPSRGGTRCVYGYWQKGK